LTGLDVGAARDLCLSHQSGETNTRAGQKKKDFSSVLAGCGGEWDEQVGFPESLLVSFGFFPSVSDPDEISLLLLPGAAVS
jgi:hypothetical protein